MKDYLKLGLSGLLSFCVGEFGTFVSNPVIRILGWISMGVGVLGIFICLYELRTLLYKRIGLLENKQ
jgi:hypothetical protein